MPLRPSPGALCGGRRMTERAAHAVDTVLPRVRQWLAPSARATESFAPREPEPWDALLLRLTGKDVTRCPRCGVGHLVVVEELPALGQPHPFPRRARSP